VSNHQTEQEQLEDLKKWWVENGQSTLIGIGLAIAVVLGWQGWNNRQVAQQDNAAGIFQNLVSASTAVSENPTPEMLATGNNLADSLKKDYPSTAYAQYAALYKAKFAVDEKKLGNAETELRWVLEQKPSREVVMVTQLRLARVLMAQARFDDALDAIAKTTDQGSFAWQFADLRGDVLKLKADNAGALAAYLEARTAMSKMNDAPEKNPLLEMKIKSLESSAPAAAPQPVSAVNADEAAVKNAIKNATK
jgi:predicted negative regulator of RcsB-dependent stress response